MRRLAVLMIAPLALLGALAAPAGAATITPDIIADELDGSGGGGDTGCSLREAVAIANANSTTPEPGCAVDTDSGTEPLGDDRIMLGSSTYTLDESGSPEDANANGDLDVNPGAGDLTIDGTGPATTTISQSVADRVLHQVTSGDDALTVSDLTITGGAPADSFGGGGLDSNDGDLVLQNLRVTTNTADGVGAGVAGLGDSLQITTSTISNNTSTSASGGGGVFINTTGSSSIASSVLLDNHVTGTGGPGGGGLAAFNATVSVTGSVIADNDVTDTGTSTPVGGGINAFNNSLTIRGTTISGNEVLGGNGRQGGGIRTAGGSQSLTLVNSTISGNQAVGTASLGGGVLVGTGSATLVHTTIGPNEVGSAGSAIAINGPATMRGSVLAASGSGGTVCAGAPTSGGGNVAEDLSCSLSGTGDVTDVSPQLAFLANNAAPNAGATGFLQPLLTHLPAETSPAVDRVPAPGCVDQPGPGLLGIDQRGLPRPDDGNSDGVAACESGSVELQIGGNPPPPPPPPAGGGSQPTAQQPAPAPVAKKKCKKKKAKKGASAAKKCKRKRK